MKKQLLLIIVPVAIISLSACAAVFEDTQTAEQFALPSSSSPADSLGGTTSSEAGTTSETGTTTEPATPTTPPAAEQPSSEPATTPAQ